MDGGFLDRAEGEWPIARTIWTKLHIEPATGTLSNEPLGLRSHASFDALEDEGITLSTSPLERETEITGPVAAKLFVSSSTADADLFLVLRVFEPSGEEVVLQGAVDPHTPIGHGWLRASHRKLDVELSTPYRPYHTHDEAQPLTPGDIYELDIEIWPTSIVVPRGYPDSADGSRQGAYAVRAELEDAVAARALQGQQDARVWPSIPTRRHPSIVPPTSTVDGPLFMRVRVTRLICCSR